MTLHRFLLVTHRWIGIGSALLLLLLGGSGAVLVYQGAIDRALAPQLYHVDPAPRRLPLDTILAIANRAHSRGTLYSMQLGDGPDVATRVQYNFRLVFIDPYRGTVKGERGIGETLTGKIRAAHVTLFTGNIGRFFNVTASFCAVFLALFGIFLWWPRRIWRVTRTRSWRGWNFDLHNILGLLASLAVIVLAGTIVLRALDPVLDPMYKKAFGTSPPVRLAARVPARGAPVSLDSLVHSAEGAVPGRVAELVFPQRPGGLVRINKWLPGGRGSRARNVVFVDPNDGRVLGVIDHPSLRLGTRMYDDIEDWHTAAIFGTPSRVVGVIACLLLVFESVSGPLIWLTPRRWRRLRGASPATKRRAAASIIAVLAMLVPARRAHAQDAFEIQVYEYETVPRGLWNLETHFNYTVAGTNAFEGSVAPTRHQTHLTFELTRGITDEFEMAGYLVLADRPGTGAEFAGWRLRPRISAPKSWELPVGLSFSAEVGFPVSAYESARTTLELRPIIEKRIGRTQIDVNPVVGRSIKGPGSGEGWDFEPGVRVAYTANHRVDLSLEYYGSTGRPFSPLPFDEQVHQFFPGADINLDDRTVLNLGVGFGATDTGNRTVLKMRLGRLFGG